MNNGAMERNVWIEYNEQAIETFFKLRMESRYQSDWKDIFC